MPTNVPPQYREAEARFRAASTYEERKAALEEMLRLVPKHKGTEKLQADIKSRLAKLRREPETKGGPRSASHTIPREGAGQIVLVGPPNGGKSSILAATTNATPKVAEYPFTTREAVPGMMPFEDVHLQLIDLPPVSVEHVEPWVFDMVRRADLAWLVLSAPAALEGFEETRELLEAKHLRLVPAGPDAEMPDSMAWAYLPTFVVLTGADREGAAADRDAFRELVGSDWPVHLVSPVDGRGFEDLARESFLRFEVIRIYTKHPGQDPDRERPFTLPRGSTVRDLAARIHKEIAEHFAFARIWGATVFEGQRVQGDHILEEGDVVEIHHT